jgi:hypothetical protein
MSGNEKSFGGAVFAAAMARFEFIMRRREALLEAWVAETGLLPSEAVLVERTYEDGSVTVTVERKVAG